MSNLHTTFSSFTRMINEAKVSKPELDKAAREHFAILEEMDTLKKKLKEIGFEDQLEGVFNELKELEEITSKTKQLIQTDEYKFIVTQKDAFKRDNVKYKEAFEEAMDKVNGRIRKVLRKFKKEVTTVSTVKASFKIDKAEKIEEKVSKDSIKAFTDKLKKIASNIVDFFKDIIKPLKEDVSKLEDVIKSVKSSKEFKEFKKA